MIKKGLFLLLLMLALPNFAGAYNYWYVTASTSPAIPGAITPPSGAGYVTSGSNTNITSDTVMTASFTVNPAPAGYTLSYVSIDGVKATPAADNVYTVTKGTRISHTINAVYATKKYTITTSRTGNGFIDPTVTVVAGTNKSISVIPATGHKIGSIMTGGATLTSGDGVASSVYTFSNIQSDKIISADFVPAPLVTARITTPSMTLALDTHLTIDGSTSTSNVVPTYTWSVTPAGGTLTPATDGKMATFSAGTVGTYTVKLTLTAPGATPSEASIAINAVYRADQESGDCTNCHSSISPQVVATYYASRHASTSIASCQGCHPSAVHTAAPDPNVCYNCHNASIPSEVASSPHNAGGVTCATCHPQSHNPDPAASVCDACHLDAQRNVPKHPFDTGAQPCISCHDPHKTSGTMNVTPSDAHFNNVTSVPFPASYVTSRATCQDCHYYDGSSTGLNAGTRRDWALSGHAGVNAPSFTAQDFKTKSGCVQCHTTTGFIAYSSGRVTSAWGTAGDLSNEVLTCIACHSDLTSGQLRQVAAVRPFADDPYTNRDAGPSNLCANCHSGTNNGKSITVKVGSADFTNLPFVAPHGLPATGNLHGKGGYHFPGQTYAFYSSNTHRVIGMENRAETGAAGPCIACHMTTQDKHLYKTVSTDENGSITAISSTVCVKCHGNSVDGVKLAASEADFTNAMNVLRLMLAQRGFQFSDSEPYFSNTNWGSEQEGANVMGAAYNYANLMAEPGGYVHNPAYTRKLISDSIDYLHNGAVTGSLDSALASLVATGSISKEVADQASGYSKSSSTCVTCHNPASTASHSYHLADGISCEKCHVTTAISNTSVLPDSDHLNSQVEVAIGYPNNKSGGSNFSRTTNSCSGISCHGNGTSTVVWGSGLATCESCHVGNIAVMDGVTAPDRSLSSSKGHGKPGIANLCLDCHDMAKQHINGLGRLQDVLSGSLNTECNYCHNDSNLIQNEAMLNLGTHITKSGGYMACSDCHDPHGSANLAMIKESILGYPITYTTESSCLIDTTTNMGFCQVCHTETKYFRAGVPEMAHESTGCLGCHTHKAAAGGFMVNPRKQCDSCHGYPPAPAYTLAPMGFGTMNNWSSASFEKYSGGGGAHLVAGHVPREAKRSDGWLNCVMCHDPRLHPDDLSQDDNPILVSQVQVVVQSKYRFDNSFTVYTGARLVDAPQRNATGSCFNLSCHMTPSPRWSVER